MSIASTGTAFNFYTELVATGNGGNWLTITPATGVHGTPSAFTVNVANASALPAGTYTGEIIFFEYPNNTLAMTVPVTLTIEAAASGTFFDNLPGELSYFMTTDGIAPAQSVQIRNGGVGNIEVDRIEEHRRRRQLADSVCCKRHRAFHCQRWHHACKAAWRRSHCRHLLWPAGVFDDWRCGHRAGVRGSGRQRIPPGESDQLYDDARRTEPAAAGAEPREQPIPTSIFTWLPLPTGTGGSWLAINPASGVLTTPEATTVSVNATTLPAGTYTGEVVYFQYPSNTLALTVPVTLTIVAPDSRPYFDNFPGGLSFFTAGGTPPPQTLQVRNAGIGTLSWTRIGVHF